MKSRLQAIARRRAALEIEIGQQRTVLRDTLSTIAGELAFAGLGLVAGRMLARRPWLRALVLGGMAAFAARRLAAR